MWLPYVFSSVAGHFDIALCKIKGIPFEAINGKRSIIKISSIAGLFLAFEMVFLW